MEDRMTFGDLITSENINDETHVIIRDYMTTKKGRWFEDAIIAYSNRAVYCFKVFPYTNDIVVELAGKWNMPEYYNAKYVIMAVPRVMSDAWVVDVDCFEYTGTVYTDIDAARRELNEALHDSGIDHAWVKEI